MVLYCRINAAAEEVGPGDDDDEEKRAKEEFLKDIIAEFSTVSEDDEMGMLANKLGAADLKDVPKLTDNSIGPFITKHNTAIVTFYQNCEYALI